MHQEFGYEYVLYDQVGQYPAENYRVWSRKIRFLLCSESLVVVKYSLNQLVNILFNKYLD